ncbi:SDR family oxidoreductase [Planococcus sp. N028]|uniref:SDR family oxidoreductase n=1 Tax=Planococcus shixiaomingii TaxID=3058393 RepID=A0ABT8N668_9BACL|nr:MULTISPECIES: SDR family oxidoreductase [unclassified Planococcus (in: firmicutes)]MDN7243233.1 SDR family oxidoreductase [Planococcus sp. N028]WKA55176.1 SDR family oxidoreductase [Planococcus sp. N022]
MDLGVKGKVVVVMASSKGLGKATAMEFAKEGATVIISSRSQDALEQTKNEIQQRTGNDDVHVRVCDMAKERDITLLFQFVIQKFGRIDVLINNTGGPKAGGFSSIDDTDWYNAFDRNLLSYIRTARAVLPHMKKQQFGRIINISSSSTKEVIDGLILSNTFRAGMVGFSKTLAREVASDNIMVNTIGPGRIATDRIAELNQIAADRQQVPIEKIIQKSESEIPIGRFGEPEEFAKIVVFLASSANSYLTGQSLVIDGGLLKAL